MRHGSRVLLKGFPGPPAGRINARCLPGRVRGPKIPIDRTTISIDAEIRPKTPAVPKFCGKKAMRKLVKTVEIRLKE
jgi:hypothetical protein